ELKNRSQRNRVLNQVTFGAGRQLLDGKRAELNALGGRAWGDLVGVVEDDRTTAHQFEVPIHGVLVEGDQHVEVVAGTEDRLVGGAQGEQDVSAAYDRLVGVVGVEVESATNEDTRQD